MATFGIKQLEDAIGLAPFAPSKAAELELLEQLMSKLDKANAGSITFRLHLNNWLVKKGIPEKSARTANEMSAAKAYAVTGGAYLKGWRARVNPQWDLLGGSDDDEAEASVTAETATAASPPKAEIDAREVMQLVDGIVKKHVDERFANVGLSEKTKTEIRDVASQSAISAALRTLEEKLPPRSIEIKNIETGTIKNIGVQHFMFDKLLRLCRSKNHQGYSPNIWLSGVTGGGKTTAVQALAEALGVEFEAESGLEAKFEILGHISPEGKYIETAFFRRFTQGGIMLLDEIDTYSARALLAFNSGAANNFCQFPHGMFKRHKDFILIAAGNTWGLGATNDYTGRTKIDAATLNRFATKLHWVIDEKLERHIASEIHSEHGPRWHDLIKHARGKARHHGLKIILSPRDTFAGAQFLRDGFDLTEVLDMTILANLSDEQRRQLDLGSFITAGAPVRTSFGLDNTVSIQQALRNGNKIEAIKLYREQHGCGLFEAKTAIEDMEAVA